MKTWREWNWHEDPEGPRTWTADDQVVLTDGLLAAGLEKDCAALEAVDARLFKAARSARAASVAARWRLVDPIRIYVESPNVLGNVHPTDARCFLAFGAERQVDLNSEENMRAICRVRTARRALVLRPRERLDLNFHGTLPGDWGLGYCSMHARFDLIVVRGPSGADAWPMHPAWVEDIREQAASVNIAFAFLGWGDWKPLDDGHGPDDCIVDGCRFARVGAARSGRILNGKTYEQLPEVF